MNDSSPQQQQIQTETVNSSSAKRKFVDDSEQFVNAKRLHFCLEDQACQLEKQRMPVIITCAPTDYKPSSNAMANFANQNMATDSASFDMITPPTDQQQQLQLHLPLPLHLQSQKEQLDDDSTMMDDEYTDEDESLQTPSYMNGYISYISTDVGQDVEDGGYTGQLERGWSEMFNEMYE